MTTRPSLPGSARLRHALLGARPAGEDKGVIVTNRLLAGVVALARTAVLKSDIAFQGWRFAIGACLALLATVALCVVTPGTG